MADASKRWVSANYRRAEYLGDAERGSLEDELRRALKGGIAEDYEQRQLAFNSRGDKALLDDHEPHPPGFFFSVHEIDSNRDQRFIRRPATPSPRPDRLLRKTPDLEDHVQSTSYALAVKNHVVVIESAGLRSGGLAAYLNALLQLAGHISPGEEWKLRPRIEIDDAETRVEGITHLQVTPKARLVGEGPSRLPQDRTKRAEPTRKALGRRERGGAISSLLETLGASSNELNDWREQMSEDLGLEARVLISVKKNRRDTEALLSGADFAEALASLEVDNDVALSTPEGHRKGSIGTLKKYVELSTSPGGFASDEVARSLADVLQYWSGKSLINIVGG